MNVIHFLYLACKKAPEQKPTEGVLDDTSLRPLKNKAIDLCSREEMARWSIISSDDSLPRSPRGKLIINYLKNECCLLYINFMSDVVL